MNGAWLSKRVSQGARFAIIAALIVVMAGCSGKPSERDALSAVETKSTWVQDGGCRIKNFKKVNGSTGSLLGQEMYTMECTWDLEYLKGTPGGLFGKPREKGDVEPKRGSVIFLKTERGWRADMCVLP